MTQSVPGAVPWGTIRLAVFDVDGTLYRQKPLRLRMARDMLLHAVRRRDWTHLMVLRAYRRLREEIGDAETDGFDPVLTERTAAATGTSAMHVRTIVAEWMEERPLRHIAACGYSGLPELFDGLRSHGKRVGILSDYPAHGKLAQLKLAADHVAWAGEPDIGILKPHPRGLQHLMALAGVEPEQTVLIGDRAERDGMAARRAGAHALIRSDKPLPGWITFRRFDDPVFAPMLAS
jgi:putative hydrolase of the HAD superfamily